MIIFVSVSLSCLISALCLLNSCHLCLQQNTKVSHIIAWLLYIVFLRYLANIICRNINAISWHFQSNLTLSEELFYISWAGATERWKPSYLLEDTDKSVITLYLLGQPVFICNDVPVVCVRSDWCKCHTHSLFMRIKIMSVQDYKWVTQDIWQYQDTSKALLSSWHWTFLVQEWNSEFGSNTTEKFEISRGEAKWDFKFLCGVWKPNSKFHSPQKRVCN